MPFMIFPLSMVVFCAVMMVLMTHSTAHAPAGNAPARAGPIAALTALRNGVPVPVWLGLALLGFLVWWPLGVVILACLVWSTMMRCCGLSLGPWSERAEQLPSRSWWGQQPTSGNRSFDDYRAETLRRLEQEERDFQDFLARLRTAKDKAEFDQFMAARRAGQEPAT
jgi:hypothetical protein